MLIPASRRGPERAAQVAAIWPACRVSDCGGAHEGSGESAPAGDCGGAHGGSGKVPRPRRGRGSGRDLNRGAGRYVYVGGHKTKEPAVPAAREASRGRPRWHCLFRYC